MSTKASKATGGLVLGACLFSLLWIFVILPLALMWAWNIVVPTIFHGPTIVYVEAFAITVLIGLLRGLFSGASKS